MNWLWPGFLLLLGLLPLLIAAYIWTLRRRRRFAVRYSSLALVRQALPRQSRLRRHLPFALFMLALGSLVLALGRPVTVVHVPAGQATIILAVDVSRSMCSTDIPPNRLAAAQEAALSFIRRQEPGIQIGLVAFSGFAELVQEPTTDQAALEAAVESLLPGRGTAIGNGILRSLDAIADLNPGVAASVYDGLGGEAPAALPEGVYAPQIIVLLTDGVTTTGVWPLEAAQQAAARGIRVFTIGFGTELGSGSFRFCGQQYLGGNNWQFGGGGGSGGGRFRRGIDEATLVQIADITGGDYYSAESAGELHEVFQELPTSLITRPETTEVSFAFAAVGALLAALALLLSQLWHPLP